MNCQLRVSPVEGGSRPSKDPQRPSTHFQKGPEEWSAPTHLFTWRVRNLIPGEGNLSLKQYPYKAWVAPPGPWTPCWLDQCWTQNCWSPFLSYLISLYRGKHISMPSVSSVNKTLWGFFFWTLSAIATVLLPKALRNFGCPLPQRGGIWHIY